MRVLTSTIDEFLICLRYEKEIFQKIVRVSVYPQTEDEMKREVILHASALIIVDESAEYLLELGLNCGKDYLDGVMEQEGTEMAENVKEQIDVLCKERGWSTLPGVIDV